MTYIKRNVNGSWRTYKPSNEAVKDIRMRTLRTNIKVMEKVIEDCPEEWPDELKAAVFNTVATHYHFSVEDYVDSHLDHESID